MEGGMWGVRGQVVCQTRLWPDASKGRCTIIAKRGYLRKKSKGRVVEQLTKRITSPERKAGFED